MEKFLQYIGWRDSPGSTRLFGSSTKALIAFVVIVFITAAIWRIFIA